MSWMGEIAIIIDDARALGITLTLSDFRREGDQLTIDGMPVDEWLSAMTEE